MPKDNNDSILDSLIGESTIDWLTGEVGAKPLDIKKLGDDFAQKLNWYIGTVILTQYARIPVLLDSIKQVEAKIVADIPNLSEPKELVETYKMLSGDVSSIMEFARKFVVQNKEHLSDNASFVDRQLFEKIKSMSVDEIRDYLTLFQIVDVKGKAILKEIIEKYK
jgi:hypothetical protein